MATHYELLGVSEDATAPEIKRAYQRVVREKHPDHAPNGSDFDFDRLLRARLTLLDPAERARYDATLADAAARAAEEEAARDAASAPSESDPFDAEVVDADWGQEAGWQPEPPPRPPQPPPGPPPPPPNWDTPDASPQPPVDMPLYRPGTSRPHHGGFNPAVPSPALTWWRVSKGATPFHWFTGGVWAVSWVSLLVVFGVVGSFQALTVPIVPNWLAIAFGVRRIRGEGSFMYLLIVLAAGYFGYYVWNDSTTSPATYLWLAWIALWLVTYVLAVESRRRFYARRP